MTVFVGRRLCDEKNVGVPEDALPREENTLAGFVADCDLLCVKVRAEPIVKAAALALASGDILEVANGRELRSSIEAVLAAILVRDAIVRVWTKWHDG